MRTYRIRVGWIPLVFGMAALWVALAGLQYVLEAIAHALSVLQQIGAKPDG